MGQGEGTLIAGTGSQLRTLSRWGDYSSLGVDPVDDCTFWFTSEYLASSGTFNWHTRIGTFQLPGCAAPATPDYAVSATPASQTVAPGSGTGYTVERHPDRRLQRQRRAHRVRPADRDERDVHARDGRRRQAAHRRSRSAPRRARPPGRTR